MLDDPRDYLYLALAAIVAAGIAYAYYRVLLGTWVRKFRHPRWRRAWAIVLGILIWIALVLFVFREQVSNILPESLEGLPDILLVSGVWVLVTAIIYAIVMAKSRNTIDH